ncbi:MAG: pyridoxine 4-dehydrogenase [Thermoplasmata archaeon]|jgi:aryl-alcohol dehydrogenase-like predicted oxidoreductase|nr:pyridoxine 4-dehydrogenase [Thermoplasmata archaeon]
MDETFRLGGDLPVRRIGLGTNRLQNLAQPDATRLLTHAADLRVDFVDTADVYGDKESEARVGGALAELARRGRDEAEASSTALPHLPRKPVVATKGGMTRGPAGSGVDGSPKHLRAALEASLARLGVARVDLYYLHKPDPAVPLAESVRALAEMRDEGKIRHVGLCNVTVAQLDEARAIVPIAAVQNRYHLGDRASEDVLAACERLGIAFVPWYPLGKGTDLLARIAPVAQRLHATPAQVALAWLLHRSRVMLPIPGTTSLAHLEENAAAGKLRLAPADVAELEGGG